MMTHIPRPTVQAAVDTTRKSLKFLHMIFCAYRYAARLVIKVHLLHTTTILDLDNHPNMARRTQSW